MNRLQTIEKELVASKPEKYEKKQLDFQYFKNLPTIDRQELKEIVYGPNWKRREDLLNIVEKN